MNEEQIFYLQSRGLSKEEAYKYGGKRFFVREVIKKLPLEFAVEAKELLSIKLEKSIG